MPASDSSPPAPGLLSTADLAQTNRGHVLQAVADHGPLSRADLARLAGVPRATIGGIVTGLIASGVLEESAPRRPEGGVGKPARPLWFGPRVGLTGAVFVQAGAVEIAVVGARGEVVERATAAFAPSARTTELDQVLEAAVTGVLGAYADRLSGIGIAVPAVCDVEAGTVLACTPVPGLVGSGLVAGLRTATGLDVRLEEDARALAVGQRWFGQARGAGDFAALQIGTGIGAGIVLGGRLYRSGRSISEIGHTCVDIHGARCRCGLVGCWETVASLRWLRHEARAGGLPGGRTATPAGLAAHARDGDRGARDLLARYADHVAIGIANLVQLLDLRLFVLHGEVVGGGQDLLDLIRAAVGRRTLPVLTGEPRVEFAPPEQDAGLLGAAATMLTHRLGIAV